MKIKRFSLLSHGMAEIEGGEWVKFEDVKKLVIKLTQDETWNDISIEPIEGEECLIMLIDGEVKPASIIDGVWTKLIGYPYDFDFKKSDVIKWKYNMEYKNH